MYFHCDACPVYPLAVYPKSERENLTQAEVAFLEKVCKELADEHR